MVTHDLDHGNLIGEKDSSLQMAISSLVLPQTSFERFIMNNLIEMFSYAFMLRSLIAGYFRALSAALVGTQLVCPPKIPCSAMDYLTLHLALLPLPPLTSLAPIASLNSTRHFASFFVLRLDQSSKLRGDSHAIALMSASARYCFIRRLSCGTNVVLTATYSTAYSHLLILVNCPNLTLHHRSLSIIS